MPDHMQCMGAGCETIIWKDPAKLFQHGSQTGHAVVFYPSQDDKE